MNDLAYQETMFMLDSMEYQINRVYRQAEKELEEKVYKFYKDFARLDTQRLKEVADGKITQAEYDQWRRNKIFNGKVWEQRKDIITKDLHNAHDIAQSVVYGYLPEVYAVNHNFATYQIEKEARIDTSYTLYSHETVERLLSENPELIPYRKLNEAKFNSWTKKNIQAVMLQGVLQGESIPRIAKRLAKTVSEKDRKCAIRDARTMTTGAMNGGKYDALKRVQKMGVNVRARWRATFDDRTRDSHRALDGEIVDIGQPFSNGLLFPVDLHELESGQQISVQRFGIICRETYNCRCAVQGVYKGLEPRAIKYRSDAAVGIPYEEWKKGHKAANEYRIANGKNPHTRKGVEYTPKIKPKNIATAVKDKTQKVVTTVKEKLFHSPLMEKWLGKDYTEVKNIIEKAPTKGLFAKMADTLTGGYKKKRNGGVFRQYSKEIEWDYEVHAGMHKYSTLAHECGHLFDHELGRADGLHFNEVDKLNTVSPLKIKPFEVVASSSDEFLAALREDMQALQPYVKDGSIATMFKRRIDEAYYNSTAGVQDALDGFYGARHKGAISWGHGEKYYNRKYTNIIQSFGFQKDVQQVYKDLGFDVSNQTKVKKLCRQYEAASEAFANINSAYTVGGMELEAIEKYMPKSLEVFKQIAERNK